MPDEIVKEKITAFVICFIVTCLLTLFLGLYWISKYENIRMAELGYQQTHEYHSAQTGLWIKK